MSSSVLSIQDALATGSLEALRVSLASKEYDPDEWVSDGFEWFTPLSMSAQIENFDFLMSLLEAGANPLALDEKGTTALSWAPDQVWTSFLVEHGARVFAEKPEDGMTSVHRAAASGNGVQLNALLEVDGRIAFKVYNDAGWTPLGVAAHNGHCGIVSRLLAAGHPVDDSDSEWASLSPLQLALTGGHEEVARLLLDAGADPGHHLGLTSPPYQLALESGIAESLGNHFLPQR